MYLQRRLTSIRPEQAVVFNQKQNVIEAAGALRFTTNATQKAANSYLKMDYGMIAQQNSKTIRTMVHLLLRYTMMLVRFQKLLKD